VCAVAITALTGCGGGKGGNWENERDSVMNVNEQQRQVLDDLTATLVEVSSSLDSIAVGEGMLRESNEGPVLTKRQMLDNIAAFKETLAANKERLAELERQLAGRSDELAKLGRIVKHLNEELAAKEARINQLEEELQSANANIDRMRSEMNDMTTTIGSQQDEINTQRETMQTQDAALNTAYYIIGTKRELKDKGLVSGGNIFKKKKVNYGSIDEALFEKIDIREVTELTIPSKKVKVLTEMPEDAYTITNNGNSSVLRITNVSRFWGVSNFLIIQID
jgi:chromosome segregation ATPase